jgi:hypothetical protein
MARFRVVAAVAALLVFDAVLPAGVVGYTLNNRRFFPTADGTVSDTTSNTLTTATVDSVLSNHTDPLSGNQFSALSGITGSPFQLHDVNTVTINQPTDSSCCGILSLVSSAVQESGVVITGNSGIGYLLPTFRVHGTFDDNNAGLVLGVSTCVGANGCILAGPAGTSTPGFQNVDTLYTPLIDSTTQFTFGTPFTFFFFLEPAIEYTGPLATPGGASTVDMKMDLVGVRIVNAAGQTIAGNINSTFFEIASPEPGSILLCGLGLAAVLKRRRR